MAAIINARDTYLQASSRATALTIILSNSITGYGVILNAVNTSSALLTSYTYKLGNGVDNSWATATVLAITGSSTYSWKAQTAGIYTLWCAGTDVNGNSSTPVSTVITIGAPGYTAVQSLISGPNLKLTWTISDSAFVIDRYEIRYGNSWDDSAAVVVATTYSTTYTTRVDYLGSRIWWVAAKNIAGTYSTPTGVNVTINKPSIVSQIVASVVDNNALVSWTNPTIGSGQLPIDSFVVKKGDTYASSVIVGSNGNSNFTSIFEQTGGNYTYWVVGIDTAGNEGFELSKLIAINQPPDYILRNNYNSNFTGGTASNFYIEGTSLIGPVSLAQTWTSHFQNNSWTSPDNQISAGYPIYATPSLTTGTYEETIDYLTTIPSTIITSTITAQAVVGTVTTSCVISWKLAAGDAWTVLATGTTGLLPAFRYVRVQYAFTAAAGSNLVKITALNIKLATKQRTDAGTTVYDSTKTDAQNFIPFNFAFVYSDIPVIQANNTIAITPVVVYSGGTNPTGFSVRLYDRTGNPTSSSYSWSARGY